MDALTALLSSKAKLGIIRCLYRGDALPIHVRELARTCECSLSAVQRELKRLIQAGLVLEKKDGNRTYLLANRDHPFAVELSSLVRKSDGLATEIRTALGDSEAEIAFLFGSIAVGQENPTSDIDLMVIGDLGLRDVVKRLSGLSERLGRELNPHVFTPAEWSRRVSKNDHFIATVLNQPKQFAIGGQDELERMAE